MIMPSKDNCLEKNGILSDMDEHSLFLENFPPLDEQFQNKGVIDEPKNVSSKQQ